MITAAVFASFIISANPVIKPIGLTLAVGVLLDAFVVRLSLGPAVLALAGRAIWYTPRWFDRWAPGADVAGSRPPAASGAGHAPGGPGTVPVGPRDRSG